METNEIKPESGNTEISKPRKSEQYTNKRSSQNIPERMSLNLSQNANNHPNDSRKKLLFNKNADNDQFIEELNKEPLKEEVEEPKELETSPKKESVPDVDFLEDDLDEETTLKTGEQRKTIVGDLMEIKEKEESVHQEEELDQRSEVIQEEPAKGIDVLEQNLNNSENSDILNEKSEKNDNLKDSYENQDQSKTNERKSNILTEDNIIKPEKNNSEEIKMKALNQELKEYFPTDNESVDTVNQSKNLTSRYKKKPVHAKKNYKKREQKKPKLNPKQYREQNFNMSGMIHMKMKEYNSLTDHSLKKFFCSPDKVRHMTKVGLITKKGLIIKNPEAYLKMKSYQNYYSNSKLPQISKQSNRSVKSKFERSTLSGNEVRKAIKAKSLKAKKKLQKGLSPLGMIMMKENKRKMKASKKMKGKKLQVSRQRFENYLKRVENLYNIK
jgi:hypothetical protein